MTSNIEQLRYVLEAAVLNLSTETQFFEQGPNSNLGHDDVRSFHYLVQLTEFGVKPAAGNSWAELVKTRWQDLRKNFLEYNNFLAIINLDLEYLHFLMRTESLDKALEFANKIVNDLDTSNLEQTVTSSQSSSQPDIRSIAARWQIKDLERKMNEVPFLVAAMMVDQGHIIEAENYIVPLAVESGERILLYGLDYFSALRSYYESTDDVDGLKALFKRVQSLVNSQFVGLKQSFHSEILSSFLNDVQLALAKVYYQMGRVKDAQDALPESDTENEGIDVSNELEIIQFLLRIQKTELVERLARSLASKLMDPHLELSEYLRANFFMELAKTLRQLPEFVDLALEIVSNNELPLKQAISEAGSLQTLLWSSFMELMSQVGSLEKLKNIYDELKTQFPDREAQLAEGYIRSLLLIDPNLAIDLLFLQPSLENQLAASREQILSSAKQGDFANWEEAISRMINSENQALGLDAQFSLEELLSNGGEDEPDDTPPPVAAHYGSTTLRLVPFDEMDQKPNLIRQSPNTLMALAKVAAERDRSDVLQKILEDKRLPAVYKFLIVQELIAQLR